MDWLGPYYCVLYKHNNYATPQKKESISFSLKGLLAAQNKSAAGV